MCNAWLNMKFRFHSQVCNNILYTKHGSTAHLLVSIPCSVTLYDFANVFNLVNSRSLVNFSRLKKLEKITMPGQS